MKWIYGKHDWKTIERGQENCFLMTNGLGGFSSMTILGSAARNDHAALMACLHAPNQRWNLIHWLDEMLTADGEETALSTQEFADGSAQRGFACLSSFCWEDTPVWRYQTRGIEIRKEAAMKQETNTLALQYRIGNRSRTKTVLRITPFFQFVPKGQDLEPEQTFQVTEGGVSSRGISLSLRTNGEVRKIEPREETLWYCYDVCDGRRSTGRARGLLEIFMEVPAGSEKTLDLVFETEPGQESAEEMIRRQKEERQKLTRKAGFASALAGELAKGAGQFLSRRESTNGMTILAGFPFFEDWGRDTMIALPGLCLSTGRFEAAKDILRTFAHYEWKGLMPNLFPEGGKEPMYNTADAALLFINGVYLYWKASEDTEFVRELYPVMERIANAYQEGTGFGIGMDEDGLIHAGQGLDQVTWMDVRVGEILPTPRHGKPVEINAYWYNALRILEVFSRLLDRNGEKWGMRAEQVKASFNRSFWMEEKGCLKDLVSGTPADFQIRCNQIWAVSMPFGMLDEEKERQVVETVFEKLHTPYGLRTLEMEDPQFHPRYGGEMMERDLAYHQGTVWVFPLGAYYLAYLKVHHYSSEAKEAVREELEVLESALREGCVGQLPEIYDGENPTASRGCFAQAWSVGEILRVYEALERR